MSVASFDDIAELVLGFLEKARDAAGLILFEEYRKKHARARERVRLLGNQSHFARLPQFYGMSAWAAILSVDLRESTDRALRVGAQNTYIAMHVLLPTLAELVGRAGGSVVGLRGDGLIASFGLTRIDTGNPEPSNAEKGKAVQDASLAGRAMLEAVALIINPILDEEHIPGNLHIGVGIDVGRVVVTRIGIDDVQEVTVYGDCVNNACHMKPDQYVMLSAAADNLYPTSLHGRIRTVMDEDGENIRVIFPAELTMLKR